MLQSMNTRAGGTTTSRTLARILKAGAGRVTTARSTAVSIVITTGGPPVLASLMKQRCSSPPVRPSRLWTLIIAEAPGKAVAEAGCAGCQSVDGGEDRFRGSDHAD